MKKYLTLTTIAVIVTSMRTNWKKDNNNLKYNSTRIDEYQFIKAGLCQSF